MKNRPLPFKYYRVGGAVRDQLLRYPSHETDYVVVGATPADMLEAGFLPVGKSFPVFLHPKTKEEYALARSEKKVAKGYHGFEFYADPSVTLEEDLMRRDLTINAMAMDDDDNLIDPYGGKRDLDQKILRHVSDAFVEDPVRILRIARFAARFHHLGFTIAPETMKLMQAMVDNGEVDALVAERVWKETEKAFEEKNPEIYIQTLKDCGALKILFPGINAAIETEKTERYTALQTITQNTINSPETPAIRFAVLAHDIFLNDDRVPPNWEIYPLMWSDNQALLKRIPALNAHEIIELLENLDAFRRNPRFQGFLRMIKVLCGKQPAETLDQACRKASEINISDIIKGLNGPQIKEAIHAARIKAIDAWLKSR